MDSACHNHDPDCLACGKPIYWSKRLLFENRLWHVQCFKCNRCAAKLGIKNDTQNSACLGEDMFLRCIVCHKMFKEKKRLEQNEKQAALTRIKQSPKRNQVHAKPRPQQVRDRKTGMQVIKTAKERDHVLLTKPKALNDDQRQYKRADCSCRGCREYNEHERPKKPHDANLQAGKVKKAVERKEREHERMAKCQSSYKSSRLKKTVAVTVIPRKSTEFGMVCREIEQCEKPKPNTGDEVFK